MRRKPEQLFKSEAELCAAFAKVAEAAGWTVYPETEGWDQLLVNAAGEQIGVQAKLRPTIEVLHQAIETDHPAYGEGPDYRFLLIGVRPNRSFRTVARHMRLLCVDFDWEGRPRFPSFRDYWVDLRRYPKKRHTLPEFIPDVPAGVPGPKQLTPWKIRAIRVCCALRIRGHVTKADFRRYKVDHRRWVAGDPAWLRCEEDGRWVAGGKRLPDEDHPKVSAEIMEQVKAELEAA